MRLKANLIIIADVALVNLSIVIAYFLRSGENIRSIGNVINAASNITTSFLFANTLIKITCYYLFRLYSSLWQYAGIYEGKSIFKAVTAGNTAVYCLVLMSFFDVHENLVYIAYFTDMFLIAGSRFSYRVLRRMPKKKHSFSNLRRALIVGNGEVGAIVVKELILHPELGSIPVAIVDEDKAKIGKKISGVPIIGQNKDIPAIVKKKYIDEIIITIPLVPARNIKEIYLECLKTHCKVKILPSFTHLIDESVIVRKIREVNIEDLLDREPVKLDINGIASYLEDQVVLVTGGGGSIGSELCRHIAVFGPEKLILLDNYENSVFDIQNELIASYPELELKTVIANIREKDRIYSIFKQYKPTVVFHAAAHKHVPLMEDNACEAVKNNIFGTMNVAECAHECGVKKFVLISTDKAVNPRSIMGATKRAAEMLVQSFNIYSETRFSVVRFGNVLGSNGSVIPLFKNQIEQGVVTVTHPEVTRYFMTIREAAQLVIQAGAMAKGGEIFVLDMGKPVKIYDLAVKLIKLSGYEPNVDIKIKFTGLRPGEKMHEELILAEEKVYYTDNEKIFLVAPLKMDYYEFRKKVEGFNSIDMNNKDEVVEYLSRIVETYKRQG